MGKNITMTFERQEELFAAMDANPMGVYWVETYDHGQTQGNAIFSTKAKVEEYLAVLPEYITAVVAPFVVDEPDFGNKRLKELS